MVRQQIVVGAETFDFEYHSKHSGGWSEPCVAVNVKNSCYITLPKTLQRRFDILAQESPTVEEWLNNVAWESTQESWWDWAQERSTEERLGKVYSAGRSGGWLIFSNYNYDAIENMAAEYNDACAHCDRPYEVHANGQCLFDTTKFKSVNESNLETFRALKKLCQEFSESAKNAHEDYRFRYYEELGVLWDQRRETKKLRSRLERRPARATSTAHRSNRAGVQT